MTIGIDIRALLDRQYTGVSECTFNLIQSILELDKKNHYKLFYNSAHNARELIPDFSNYNNVEVVYTRYPNKIYNYLMHKILHYPKVDKFLNVDIFWMPHINFINLSKDRKSILTIHDLSFLRYPQFFSFKKNIWHYLINVKKLMRTFNKIIAVSKNTKSDIIELCGINSEKVEIIYPGIPINNYQFAITDLHLIKRKYNLPKKFILYLGTLEPRKNIEGIVKAYNQLRIKRPFDSELQDVKLVIAGGVGWKTKSIFNEMRKSKYKTDIKILGYIPNEEKKYFYNLAEVFVYPSFYEGFGFPPLEAMACGAPVITSFISSVPEVVENSAIMIDPYNIHDISNVLEQVLKDRKLRDYLIKQGLIQAQKFNWRIAAQKYLEIFDNMV